MESRNFIRIRRIKNSTSRKLTVRNICTVVEAMEVRVVCALEEVIHKKSSRK
jgi:hypothetical protein